MKKQIHINILNIIHLILATGKVHTLAVKLFCEHPVNIRSTGVHIPP